MCEASALSDLIESEIGGEKKALDIAEAEAEDFVFGGATEGGFHAALKRAAGSVQADAEVFHGDSILAALADETGGAGDKGIGDDEVV